MGPAGPPGAGRIVGAALGGYFGMVKRLDEALGRMRDALKSLGMADNTVILFTSDHGNHFKTRNPEYKRSCHEASVRVHGFLRPRCFDGAGCVNQQVSLLDLPPTLLDAAGIDIPETMEGRSILPLLNGGDPDWPEEAFIQISESQIGRAAHEALEVQRSGAGQKRLGRAGF